MPSVDKRVVEMKFDNAAFERGIAQTMQSLEDLKTTMNFDGAKDSLDSLSKMGEQVTLGGLAESVDSIASKFSVMGVVGFTAIQNLTNAAIGFAKSKFNESFGAIMEGGKNRALNIEQAKFSFKGLGLSAKQVTQAMDDALYAVKGTAFGLDAAAGAASQLSASGVKLGKDMKASLRGISGVAAMTGSEYAEIADVFTKVAGQGRLMGDDLNRLAARGLNVAATLGKSMGKTEAQIREMVTKGQINFATFSAAMDKAYGKNATKASETYSGALSNLHAAMSRMGAAFQTPHLESQRKTLNSLTPAVDKLKTAIMPLINEFAIFDEQKNRFIRGILNGLDFSTLTIIIRVVVVAIKNLRDAILSYTKPIAAAFAEVFPPATGTQIFRIVKAFQIFTKHLILGKDSAANLKDTFQGVFSVLKVVFTIAKELGHGLFSLFGVVGKGSGDFLAITGAIGRFLTYLSNLILKTGAIKTFFGIFDSSIGMIKPLIHFVILLADAIVSLFKGDTRGFANKFHAALGSLMEIFDKFKDKIQLIISTLGSLLSAGSTYLSRFSKFAQAQGGPFLGTLGKIAGAIAGLFSHLKDVNLSIFQTALDKVVSAVERFKDALDFRKRLSSLGSGTQDAASKLSVFVTVGKTITGALTALFTGIGKAFSGISKVFMFVIDGVGKGIHAVVTKLKEMFKGADSQDAVAAFNTGVLVVLYLTLRRFMKNITGIVDSFTGLMDNIGGVFEALSESLQPVQQLKSDILLKVAVAIGILVVSLAILANLDADKLKQGLIGIGILFAELSATMILMTKSGFADSGKVSQTGAMLLMMSVAIRVLTKAVKTLGEMKPMELAQGLGAVGIIMSSLAFFTKYAALDKGGVKAGIGLVLMATAINIIAIAVHSIGAMKAGDIIKAALAIDFLIGSMIAAAKGMQGALPGAAAMLVMATSLAVLIPVIASLGQLPWQTLVLGIGSIAVVLVLLSAAVNSMNGATAGAAAMIAVAAAILILTPAIAKFGEMKLGQLIKSIVALAVVLYLLVGAALAMDAALPGAAALLVVAGALAILVPVVIMLGSLPWKKLLLGIGGLALILLVLIGAVYALTPVIGIMILATKAIAILGAAMLLAGLGFLSFSAGLTALAATGAAGFAVLVAGVVSFLAILPVIAQQLGYAFAIFVKVIGDNAPKLIQAFVKIAVAWLKGIQVLVPEFIKTVVIIIEAMIAAVVRLAPKWFAAGLDIMIGFLKAIRDRIDEITNVVIDIFTAFIGAVKKRLPNIIQAGIEFLVSFMNGLAEGIREKKDEVGRAGVNIATAIIEGIGSGLSKAGHLAKEALQALGRNLIQAFKDFFGIASPSTEFAKIGGWLIEGLRDGISGAWHLVSEALQKLYDKLPAPIRKALELAGNVLGSVVSTVGGVIANGLNASTRIVSIAGEDLGSAALDGVSAGLGKFEEGLYADMDTAPVIRPVLDLSDVSSGAGALNSMLTPDPISADATYTNAQGASLMSSPTQSILTAEAIQTRKAMEALVAAQTNKVEPRPAVFHIDTVQDGDSLLSRARATNKMLSLAEGGDSTQIIGVTV